jgi:hypothetical protein
VASEAFIVPVARIDLNIQKINESRQKKQKNPQNQKKKTKTHSQKKKQVVGEFGLLMQTLKSNKTATVG